MEELKATRVTQNLQILTNFVLLKTQTKLKFWLIDDDLINGATASLDGSCLQCEEDNGYRSCMDIEVICMHAWMDIEVNEEFS